MKNTPANIIQDANKILYKFLWNGPDKIKRLTMIADISNGGLKMPHLESIIETQKVMWMKRYSENNDHPWKAFMRESLKETGSTDIYNRKIPETVLKKLDMSEFNKEIIAAWNNTQSLPDNAEAIANQILWNNEYIQKPSGETLHYDRISRLGFNQVADLVEDDKIMSIKKINNQDLTFYTRMELASIIKCIPKKWRDASYELELTESTMKEYVSDKLEDTATKSIYRKKIKKIKQSATSEIYFNELFHISTYRMKYFYELPFRTTIYTKLRSFQFKVNHNILYTNEKLHRIGKKNSAQCGFCEQNTETLSHLLAECTKVKPIWEKIAQEMFPPFGITKLCTKDIILGIKLDEKQNNIINHIILETKYYIYVCKLEESQPTYNRIKNRLKITESVERKIAYRKDRLLQHNHKWHHLINEVLS